MNHQSSSRSNFRVCLIVGAMLVLALFLTQCSEDDPVSTSSVELVVWPQSVVVSSTEGNPNLDPVHIMVDCDPHASMTFHFSCQSSWMNASNLDGTTYGITRDSFAIQFSVSSLPVGSYLDTVVVTMADVANSPQYVVVDYTVAARPADMVVFPRELNFVADDFDDTPDPATFTVRSADDAHLSYSAVKSAAWLTLSGGDGTTPDTITAAVSLSNLSTGVHDDTIWLSSDEMGNTPQSVVCQLTLPCWLPQASPLQGHRLQDLVFLDENNGFAVGLVEEASPPSRSGYIIETHNGGETWEQNPSMFLNANADEYYAFAAIEAVGSDIWAIVENGIFYHSSNGGTTWDSTKLSLTPPCDSIRDIDFADNLNGWIVGKSGLVLVTSDGGSTWDQQTTGSDAFLTDVSFCDASHGWAIGRGGVLMRTSNGGDNWETLSGTGSANLSDVLFLSSDLGYVVGSGGFIARTTDGGNSWEQRTSGTATWLHKIFFTDEMTGWAVGSVGSVVYTDDGGDTWTVQSTGTTNGHWSVFFLNETDGWIVGDYGDIRYTTSGGNE